MDALDIIEQLKAKREEFDRLIRELEVWARLKAQGIDPDTVLTLAFDPDLLTGADREAYSAGATARPGPNRPLPEWWGAWVYSAGRPQWFNVAHLKDGSARKLRPFVRAAY